jgi:hypothetical protein
MYSRKKTLNVLVSTNQRTMAKTTIFVMTHLASGWEKLIDAIHRNPRVQIFTTGASYSHPEDIFTLRQLPHKQGGAAAVWGDVILHNKDFAMRRLCQHYKLIFWTRQFDECVDELVNKHGYGLQQAELYYMYRLEGMKQYWLRKDRVGTPAPWNPNLKDNSFLDAILG